MNADKHSLNVLLLKFREGVTERAYVESVVDQTINFARIVWGSVIVLGGSFAVLDRGFFGEDASTVLLARAILFILAAAVIAGSFVP